MSPLDSSANAKVEPLTLRVPLIINVCTSNGTGLRFVNLTLTERLTPTPTIPKFTVLGAVSSPLYTMTGIFVPDNELLWYNVNVEDNDVVYFFG